MKGSCGRSCVVILSAPVIVDGLRVPLTNPKVQPFKSFHEDSSQISGIIWDMPKIQPSIGISKFTRLKPVGRVRWVRKNKALRVVSGGKYKAFVPTPGLFREFAGVRYAAIKYLDTDPLKPDWETWEEQNLGILAFAHKYGDLISPGGDFATGGAAAYEWCNAVRNMRDAVKAWDRIKSGAERPMDRVFLREVLIRNMGETTPVITKSGSLEIWPPNLLAFMWLTFARLVSGEIEERRCTGRDLEGNPCPNFVYMGRGARRADKRATCSDACRKRKQR